MNTLACKDMSVFAMAVCFYVSCLLTFCWLVVDNLIASVSVCGGKHSARTPVAYLIYLLLFAYLDGKGVCWQGQAFRAFESISASLQPQ